MKMLLICKYCDHHWQHYVYDDSKTICPVCGDKNIRFKDMNDTKVDYYIGCPPFPKTETVYPDYY